MKTLTLLALVLTAAACAQPAADSAPEFIAAPALTVFAATDELQDYALAAADRVRAATGLEIVVTTDPMVPAIPLFWTTQGEGEWYGMAHGSTASQWLGVDLNTPMALRPTVVLHEILHGLGAEHVGGGEGVLSPEVFEVFALTTADLESVCAVRACSTFETE
jgi:hypothetical protein